MKTKWLDQKISYDGSQLQPLHNYLEHQVLGDSIVGWRGPCQVSLEHMMDGEDCLARAKIEGSDMLHFVLELFDFPLLGAIAVQRLMGEILISEIKKTGEGGSELERRGDDIYWGDRKLNISIATKSATSSLIHFAFNLSNEGTPVATCALTDFGIHDFQIFAQSFMDRVQAEVLHIQRAFRKVRSF